MPVTARIATHGSSAKKYLERRNAVTSASQVLRTITFDKNPEAGACKRMLQSSFDTLSAGTSRPDAYADGAAPPPQARPGDAFVHAKGSSFISSCMEAYNEHLHLVLRPDDVWTAILTQVNFYVNAHAERLRHKFVSHAGRETLSVQLDGEWRFLVGLLATKIEDKMRDSMFVEWWEPNFTTTTPDDRTAAAAILLSTMQQYFRYEAYCSCGIPSVTLLGERLDWVNLRKKLPKLRELGDEPSAWAGQLEAVVSRMIHTFDAPDSDATRDFWGRIALKTRNGSGPIWFSGWITAFAVWDEHGKPLAENEDEYKYEGIPALEYDGSRFHVVSSIPDGYSYVPVKIVDMMNNTTFETSLVAGCMAMTYTTSYARLANGDEGKDTVQPRVDWMLFEKDDSVREDAY